MSGGALRHAPLFVALLLTGLGAGSAYTTFFLFNPAGVTTAAWIAQLQAVAPRIGIPLFVLQPAAVLGTVTALVVARHERIRFRRLALAGVALVAAGLITRFGNVPINFEIESWGAGNLPATAAELQRRWWAFHIARSIALGVACCALILAALAPAAPPDRGGRSVRRRIS